MGRPTFGKATVQYLEYLSDGGGLRYTIAKYLTPAGHDLHRDGLQPDFEVNFAEYYLQHRPVPTIWRQGIPGKKSCFLQNMLNFLDHDLEITGVFDEQTLETLKSFQMSPKYLPPGTRYLHQEQLRKSLRKKRLLWTNNCFCQENPSFGKGPENEWLGGYFY